MIPLIFAQLKDRSHVMLAALDDAGLRRVTGETSWTKYSLIYQVPKDAIAVYAWFKADLAEGKVSFGNVQIEQINDTDGMKLLSQSDGMVAARSDKRLIYKDDFASDHSNWLAGS